MNLAVFERMEVLAKAACVNEGIRTRKHSDSEHV